MKSRWTIKIVVSNMSALSDGYEDVVSEEEVTFDNILATKEEIYGIVHKAKAGTVYFNLMFPKEYYAFQFCVPIDNILHVLVMKEKKRVKSLVVREVEKILGPA